MFTKLHFKVFVLALFALSFVGLISAAPLDVVKATARVYAHRLQDSEDSPEGEYKWGRGTAFLWNTANENDEYAYMLTAGHLFAAKDNKVKSVWVQFFYPEMTDYIQAEIVKVNFRKWTTEEEKLYYGKKYEEFSKIANQDVAVIRIKKVALTGRDIRLKLAPSNFVYDNEDRILSFGCQEGKWPSMIYGGINAVYSSGFTFDAEVQPGRSGSPVTDETGSYVLGIVLRQDSSSVNVQAIREHLGINSEVERP